MELELAKAQAAIKDIGEHATQLGYHGVASLCDRKLSDTTALDAAIAEATKNLRAGQMRVLRAREERHKEELAAAQKPLVKDLETLIKVLNTGSWSGTRTSISDIERRLAKVKEGKS